MPTMIRYCRGCNEQFSATEDDPRCPVCRQAMTVWDVSPTMDLGQTEVYDRPAGPANRRQPPLELIGQEFAGYTIEEFVGQGGMAWVFRAGTGPWSGRARSRSCVRTCVCGTRISCSCSSPRPGRPPRSCIRTS